MCGNGTGRVARASLWSATLSTAWLRWLERERLRPSYSYMDQQAEINGALPRRQSGLPEPQVLCSVAWRGGEWRGVLW